MPKYAVDDRLQITILRTGKRKTFDSQKEQTDISLARQILLAKLLAFDDVDYDENAELIQSLVSECVEHFQKLHGDAVACNILRNDTESIANNIHQQIEAHAVYGDIEYNVKVCSGYLKLNCHCVSIYQNESPRSYRIAIPAGEKNKIKGMVFSGFSKCLYDLQKFDSDPEREFSRVLEDSEEVIKWFKPALSNFAIAWMQGNYQPDFIVETTDAKYICEVKADNEIDDEEVVRKMEAALLWCKRASEGDKKPWSYLLIPHSKITLNLDFSGAKVKFRKSM
jgi:type III restriction enzyme